MTPFLFFFLSLTQPVSGIIEIPGQSLIKGYTDLGRARKSAKYSGLRMALSAAWDKLPQDLFGKASKRKRTGLRRKVLAKHDVFFAGMGQVTEKILPGNTLQWSAVYRIDVSRMIAQVKSLLIRVPRRKVLRIYSNSLSDAHKADLSSLLHGTLWRAVFSAAPKKSGRCVKADFCLKIGFTPA
ncbi:hypothetical protein KJ865_12630, partial [Myxococcota bacterium]|nr:hypothetical protein [Myxococcota bacterium]